MHPYERAKQERRRFLRRNARILTVCAGVCLVMAIALISAEWQLAGSGGAWFAAGASTVALLWITSSLLDLDGTARLRSAAEAERWTSSAFRRLRSDGWYVVDSIPFDGFDVDHVAVGPEGVWVLETKNTNVPWRVTATGLEGPYRDCLRQVHENARTIRLLLKSRGVDVPVVPTLVVWGRGAPHLSGGRANVDDVVVLCGKQAKEWRSELTGSPLDVGQIEAVREVLQGFVEERRAHRRRASRLSLRHA